MAAPEILNAKPVRSRANTTSPSLQLRVENDSFRVHAMNERVFNRVLEAGTRALPKEAREQAARNWRRRPASRVRRLNGRLGQRGEPSHDQARGWAERCVIAPEVE